jgi:hypothetical protein
MPDMPAHAQQPEPIIAQVDYLIDFLAKLEAVLDRVHVHITVKTGDADAPVSPGPYRER